MKLVAAFLVPFLAALGQTPAPDAPAQSPVAAEQTPAVQDNQQGTAQRSTIDVKPGSPVIKQKDLWDGSGYLHPFTRMPKYIWQDQKAIWTSPFHTAKKDIKLWVIFGAATAALVATDRHSVGVLPDSSSQVSVSKWGSRFGSAYSLIPISAGFYFVGTRTHDEQFRETGLICFEALIDSNIVVELVKLAADRARPLENGGRGHFEDSPGGRLNSSFPSGHAISTWAMASVIAHQYPHHKIVPILAYGLASAVVISRVGARQHFPGDVVAGSAMGWFIGDYVYGRRHNRDLDAKQTVAQKILDRVHLGMELQ
jgi:membrane-associated phospholipid phosphatase